MIVYLKSGKTFRVSQKTAEAIIEAKTDGDSNYYVTERYKIGKNIKLFVDVSEVAAIR